MSISIEPLYIIRENIENWNLEIEQRGLHVSKFVMGRLFQSRDVDRIEHKNFVEVLEQLKLETIEGLQQSRRIKKVLRKVLFCKSPAQIFSERLLYIEELKNKVEICTDECAVEVLSNSGKVKKTMDSFFSGVLDLLCFPGFLWSELSSFVCDSIISAVDPAILLETEAFPADIRKLVLERDHEMGERGRRSDSAMKIINEIIKRISPEIKRRILQDFEETANIYDILKDSHREIMESLFSDILHDKVLFKYQCYISHLPIIVPVKVLNYPQIFERSELDKYLEEDLIFPLTNEILQVSQIKECRKIKSKIDQRLRYYQALILQKVFRDRRI
ncbi:MAG TPA: hypothetical protein P5048_03575 [Chlamydiales bacterium]|nr:hypothetical protein [Chlamydiales bacterium]